MFNSKEYYEILSIFKELISSNEITITNDSFSISSLKQILLSNPKFKTEINSILEKIKSKNEKNKNIFSLIQTLNKKKARETKLLINSISTSFSIFYNEPSYIISLNKVLYQSIIQNIQKNKEKFSPISTVNGNFADELFTVKSEFYNDSSFAQLTPSFILERIYEAKNDNLNTSAVTLSIPFKFKLNSHSLANMKETYGTMITNWLATTDEQLNNKKRRESMTKLIQESKLPILFF